MRGSIRDLRRHSAGPCAVSLLPALAAVIAACGSTVSPATPAPSSAPAPSPAQSAVIAPSLAPSTEPSVGPSVAAIGSIDPANFVTTIDNAWFPLKPGTTYTYTGIKDGQKALDTSTVTSETKVVQGVTCVVVRDELKLDGTLEERTDDWYAQDRQGNVWYFGEATAELDEAGKVTSTEGSWESGVDGARAGIFMPADPQIGDSHLQEFYAGHAEDHFVVLLTDQTIKVPAGSYSSVMVTGEWTPLEPAVLTQKAYVSGIGEVREADVVGGDEKLELTKLVTG